jgi:hypothetical protein
VWDYFVLPYTHVGGCSRGNPWNGHVVIRLSKCSLNPVPPLQLCTEDFVARTNVKAVVKCIQIVGSLKVPLISSLCPHNTTWVVEHVRYTLLSVRFDLAVLRRMRSVSGQLC